MLSHLSSSHLRISLTNYKYKVSSFLLSSLYPLIYSQQSPYSLVYSASFATSTYQSTYTQLKLPTVYRCDVGKLVFSKYSSLLDKKVDDVCVGSFSVNELLLRIGHVSPESVRKCLRVCKWRPEDVCVLLQGLQLGFRSSGFDAGVVGCLWEIFRRVGGDEGFKHLPMSVKVMASMVINVGMFREVECLLSTEETRGIVQGSSEVISDLIEGYLKSGELKKALLMYYKMKGMDSVLSLSCYRSIIDVLMKELNFEDVMSVYADIVKAGFDLGHDEIRNLERLIGFLCWDGKIKEVRYFLKKIVINGWKPSEVVLTEIANVYCEKRDFEDLLNFFAEMKCAPDILVGNKVIFQLCSVFDTHRAESFLLELEQLGFSPNEITLGIFICFSCRDGKLRNAFVYLSEIFSRGMKPDKHSYNAVISALFKAGMNQQAQNILNDMIDNGVKPDMTTFRTLLAGYCEARRFDEVKLLIKEMSSNGLIHLLPLEDPISKGFCVLGLDPMKCILKRDNDLFNFRTEFIDELGNGLYLDTNLEEFEITVNGILEKSLVPDFSLLVMRQCDSKNLKKIELAADELAQWGQELSVPVLKAFARLLCDSDYHIETIPGQLDNISLFLNKLDHDTVNMLIQALSKKGFLDKCKQFLDEMQRRHLPITNATYNSVLIGMCKLGRLTDIRDLWNLSCRGTWLPEWSDFVVVLSCLCGNGMLKELLELFDIMITSNPDSRVQISYEFLEKLCSTGFTSVGHILINELKQNYELGDILYSHLIEGYFAEKKISEALMIYDTFINDYQTLSSDVILTLIPQLCKANRFKHAVALKDIGLRDHPSISCSIFSALVNGCCKTGRLEEADDLILEMLSNNILPSAEIYDTLLQGHCKISDLKTTSELFCSMIRRNFSLSFLSCKNLIQLFCKKGLFHSAEGLKTLMILERNYSPSNIYNVLIFYSFRTGNVNVLLDDLEGTELTLDEAGYNFLVHGLSVNNDMQRSFRYLNDMIVKGLRPSNRSLRAVICYLCHNGQVLNALELNNEIESKGWNVGPTIHYALLEGLLDDFRILEAERLAAQISERKLYSDDINYNSLVRKFTRHGKLEMAVNLLDQILKSKSIPDSPTYDCITQKFCDYDNSDRAMDFLSEMLHRNLKPCLNTWDILIERLCIKGHTKEAEGLLISMTNVDLTPTKRMYSFVIDRYRLENNLSKASELLQRMQQLGYEPDFSTQWSLISSLSNSGERQGGPGSRGFLSGLLGGIGVFAAGLPKSKRE